METTLYAYQILSALNFDSTVIVNDFIELTIDQGLANTAGSAVVIPQSGWLYPLGLN